MLIKLCLQYPRPALPFVPTLFKIWISKHNRGVRMILICVWCTKLRNLTGEFSAYNVYCLVSPAAASCLEKRTGKYHYMSCLAIHALLEQKEARSNMFCTDVKGSTRRTKTGSGIHDSPQTQVQHTVRKKGTMWTRAFTWFRCRLV